MTKPKSTIPTTCEHCEHNWQARTWINQLAARTAASKAAARENGKKGGCPRGTKKAKN